MRRPGPLRSIPLPEMTLTRAEYAQGTRMPTGDRLDQASAVRALRAGERLTIAVPARDAWVAAVFVEPAQEYALTASGWWFEGARTCGPDGYRSRSRWARLLKRLRRVRSARRLALIGSIGRDDDEPFVIGGGGVFTMTRRGVLLFFANRVRGLGRARHGRVMVTVHRLK